VTIKEGLRLTIERGRKREASDLVPLVDDRPPAASGRWTIKDTVAHLSAWRGYAAGVLDAARMVSAPPQWLEDIDQQNAQIYAATRALPAGEVVTAASTSWEALMLAVDACTEVVLLQPRPRRPELKTWEVVPVNAHGHLAEHLDYLAQERGDATASEAAARWSRELDTTAFPDPKHRAAADYNFGCYFGRHGRAQEAATWFRSAFELNPALKDWARQDRDLDPVRGQPEIRQLLG
jgi:hypothetical protein